MEVCHLMNKLRICVVTKKELQMERFKYSFSDSQV